MGKSIRSKRMKKLRTLKREKLAPREQILLEQRAAILSVVKGEEVDEAAIPVLPEDANAPKRFEHTRDGKAPKKHTLLSRYGHLAHSNVSINKWNTLAALKERYDKHPAVKVKEDDMAADEPAAAAATPKKALPSTMAQRRGRGRDRTSRSVTGSTPVKAEGVEDDESMDDASASAAAISASAAAATASEDAGDLDDDTVRYGEFGKPAHQRRDLARSKLARKRSKSKSRNGFINFHNMAASS